MRFGSQFLLAYAVYIAVTRMLLSMVLFTYARTVDLNFVWTLYANQLLNAIVKVVSCSGGCKAEVGQPRQPEGRLLRRQPDCYFPRSDGGLSDSAFIRLTVFDRDDLHQVTDGAVV